MRPTQPGDMAALKECADELTKCAICLDDLVDPKSLPCLHSFCLKCIKGHCRDNSPGDQVDCPICRTPFMIPLPGVEQLKCNFLIHSLVGAKKASGGVVKPSQVLCDVCSEDSDINPSSVPTATVYCSGCGQKLCAQCAKPHKKIPGGAHQVVPFGINSEADVLQLQGSFCTVHPGNKLEIHCVTCHVNVCLTCHALKHKKHDCKDIIDVYKTCSKTLTRDVEQVAKKESSLLQEVKRLDSEQKNYVDEVESIEKELRASSNELKRRIDEAVSKLMAKLSCKKIAASKVTNAKKSDLEFALAAVQSFTRHSRELLGCGRPSDVTQAFNDLHKRADELLKRDLKTSGGRLPEVEVAASDLFDAVAEVVKDKSKLCNERINRQLTHVTRLATADKLELVHTFKDGVGITGLAVLDKELFVVYSDSTEITVYDTETYNVRRRLSIPRLGRPVDMTSCKRYRCIYISDGDNDVVHRVDNKNSITQWSVVGESPCGLSVNSVYNVLVTIFDAGEIKEFTTAGKLVRVISLQPDVFRPSHTVELTNGRYIVCHGYSDDLLDRVCVVDSSGCVLQSYGGSPGSGRGQLDIPNRQVVIGDLILLTDSANHRILTFSQSLCYICEVLSSPRIPARMWFDEDAGRLYVAFNEWDEEEGKYVRGHVKVYSV